MMAHEDIGLKLDDELGQRLLFTSLDDEVSNKWIFNTFDENEELSDIENYPAAGSDNKIKTNQAHAVQEEEPKVVV